MICIYLEEDFVAVEYRKASGEWQRLQHNNELQLWLYFKIQRSAGGEQVDFGRTFRREWVDSFATGRGGPEHVFELVGTFSERINKGEKIALNGEERPAAWLFGSVLNRIKSLLREELPTAGELPWRIGFGPAWSEAARQEIISEFERKMLPAPVVCPEGRIYSQGFYNQTTFPILILHMMGRDLYCGVLRQPSNLVWYEPRKEWGVDKRIRGLAEKLVKDIDQKAYVLVDRENIDNEVRRHELLAADDDWLVKIQEKGSLEVWPRFLRDNVPRHYIFNTDSINNESINDLSFMLSGEINDHIKRDGIKAAIFLGDSCKFLQETETIQRRTNGCKCYFFGVTDVLTGALEAMRTAENDSESCAQGEKIDEFNLLSLNRNSSIELNCQPTVLQLLALGNGIYRIIRSTSSNICPGTIVSLKNPVLREGQILQFSLQDGRIYTSRPLQSWILCSNSKTAEIVGSGFEVKASVTPVGGSRNVTQLNPGMLSPGAKVRLVGQTMGKPDSVKILEYFGDSRLQIIECNRSGLEPGALVIAQDNQWELGQNLTFLAPNPNLNRELSPWKTRRISSIEILQ